MLSFLVFGAAAIACALAGVWVFQKGARERTDRKAMVIAIGLTGVWCLCVASLGFVHVLVSLTAVASSLAWLYVLFKLFSNDGRDESLRPIRPVAFSLGFVELLQIPLVLLLAYLPEQAGSRAAIIETSAILRMLVAVGALALLHNLYGGAASTSRKLLGWTSFALALMWAWSLNHHLIIYITDTTSPELEIVRALVTVVVMLCLGLGANHASADLKFRPSRAVAFQSISLGLIAIYLVGMVFLAELAGRFSGDFGRMVQIGFLLTGALLTIVWLPSKQVRRWARVEALKHLFKHRYDYRNEWIRFTHTIGRKDEGERGLQERAVQSLADIAGCQAGLLLVRDEDGRMVLGARWRWPDIAVPGDALPDELIRLFEREQLIIDFGEVRRGVDHHGELAMLPDWLTERSSLWAAIPLLHHDRLVGLVALARPDVARPLDWEDFDLLSVAGQQVASYLAEQAGQIALNQASQFDEFNRRMAFVMHDIKNLSSQMSLLLRNAERHADNPEFRKDMLVTLRNSTDKLNSMLARLGRYNAPAGGGSGAGEEEFDLAEVGRDLKKRFDNAHPIKLRSNGPCVVLGEPEALSQALAHIVQNAIDATAGEQPVEVEVSLDGIRGKVTVLDHGCGMAPGFVRKELFKPFMSSKEGGFGIGAYEARTMIRAMGGRINVESQEGLGSRFEVCLPLKAASSFMEANVNAQKHESSEAA
ncbi:XrtA/PEP-CTERM system histidine kinase PrsK [Erythrobacter sp. W53]|uniref:XrtA/PEP-CTERM system histidine kinase PrsK n=1 Tax=Erythrobacter sp. W53 TaxID=3425947 RepID=UPI003D769C59